MELILIIDLIIIVFLLFIAGLCVYCNYTGITYIEHEKILRDHPYSKEAKNIKAVRKGGIYDVYIPPKEREKFLNKYGYLPYGQYLPTKDDPKGKLKKGIYIIKTIKKEGDNDNEI